MTRLSIYRPLGAMSLVACLALALLVWASPVLAVVPGPAWTIISRAQPTVFSTGPREGCTSQPTEEVCDSYVLLATNTGSRPTDGSPITIADSLPEGVTVTEVTGIDWTQNSIGEPLACTTVPLRCVDERPIAPDGSVQVTIKVEVTGAAGSVTNHAGVSGGGAAPAAASEETTVGAGLAPFGVRDLSFGTSALDGSLDLQAGEHPYEQSTSLDLATINLSGGEGGEEPYTPTEEPRDVVVTLPPGFVGNPSATPRCSTPLLEQTEFDSNPESPTYGLDVPKCPPGSRVGVVDLGNYGFGLSSSLKTFSVATSVFNMVPEGGHPAEFGFRFLDKVILLYADVTRSGGAYRVRVTTPGVPLIGFYHITLTLFGQPGAQDGEPTATAAFLTNPTRCSNEPLTSKVEANSWEEPGHWVSGETTAYPHVDGCGLLQFAPELGVRPESTQADAPSGFDVEIASPRASTPWGVLPAPQLKDATVSLPAGVSIDPSAAEGLQACPATGPDGIDIPGGMAHPDEAGEGEAIGPNGLSYLTAGHCPSASIVGTVEATSPILPEPLVGHVFLAQPHCGGEGQAACTDQDAANGSLFGLYAELAGSGVVVKFPGAVSVDPVSGRLTASFNDLLQQPVSDIKVHLKGGPRAPLANPQACGTATTTSDLVPWSTPTTADATPSSSFNVDWDGNGGGCPGLPFAPAFNAGTVTPSAGGFSPFTLTFSRQDREQDLGGVTVRMPPGLLGALKGVERCREPQAAQGACPAGSLIGHTTVVVGAGSHPFYVAGEVFLTGPYGGAPFGLSVVVPAKAGPFNLGNVIVRAAIHVDPHTAQITVVSDPFPQIIDGIPLRTKTVNVTVDRPGFIFNPTNCNQQQVTGTISSAQGASSNVSSPFAVAGCATLPFKPSFTVSTQANTSKKQGASLDVRVGYPAGAQANIRSVAVTLPKQLPARLTTIQQACTQAVFDTNPASCPAGSNIGTATASTPVLANPVVGPAYLVSHGGAAFPDLVVILQGEGVTLDLVGSIDIRHNITSSTFASIPDAPISSFELKLPEGPHSGLAAVIPPKAKGNMCAQKLTMPTTLTGQNGAVVKQTTKITVTGCAKTKKKPAKKKHGKAKHTRGKK